MHPEAATGTEAAAPHTAQDHLTHFLTHFDELVDTLCIASREGLTVGRAQRYQQAHLELRRTYPHIQTELDPDSETFHQLWRHEELAAAIHTAELILLVAECRTRLETALHNRMAALTA
jgi:hypothetical protein